MKNNSLKTVLLVDDEPNILIPLVFLIEKEGYNSLKAQNGLEAIELLKKEKIDIVVLDVMMPEMDGLEVANWIRNNPDLDHIRIIFLTAKATPNDKKAGYDLGGEVYITKPFDNFDLINTLNEVVEYG